MNGSKLTYQSPTVTRASQNVNINKTYCDVFPTPYSCHSKDRFSREMENAITVRYENTDKLTCGPNKSNIVVSPGEMCGKICFTAMTTIYCGTVAFVLSLHSKISSSL